MQVCGQKVASKDGNTFHLCNYNPIRQERKKVLRFRLCSAFVYAAFGQPVVPGGLQSDPSPTGSGFSFSALTGLTAYHVGDVQLLSPSTGTEVCPSAMRCIKLGL